MTVRIITADVLDGLRQLPDASVHCCVTSPPYFGLRDYGTATWESGDDPECLHIKTEMRHVNLAKSVHSKKKAAKVADIPFGDTCGHCGATRIDKQIGLEATPDAFVSRLVEVFREVRRVLRDDGTLFLNIGDSYATEGMRKAGRKVTPDSLSFRDGARRAISCGTSDKAPEGYQESDCLCGNLCDACRRAYRLGISHSGAQPVPTPAVSISSPSREHREAALSHPPTSGSTRQGGRNSDATPATSPDCCHAGAPLQFARESTNSESSRRRQGGHLLSDRSSACLSCGCSLPDYVLASAHKAGCTCGTSSRGSEIHTSGRDVLGLASLSSTTESLKGKDLIGIPWMLAFALRADGWWLRQDIIWHKPNPMPESVTDRCTKAHEYVFLLTKSARYFYDAEAIKEASVDPARAGTVERCFSTSNPASSLRGDVGRSVLRTENRNKRSVWSIATQPFAESHFATMPPELAETCIKAGTSQHGCCSRCGAPSERQIERESRSNWVGGKTQKHDGTHYRPNPGGGVGNDRRETVLKGWAPLCACTDAAIVPCTVLDLFSGAGTTALVADRLQRHAIGIELNPDYAAMSERRINGDRGGLLDMMEAAT